MMSYRFARRSFLASIGGAVGLKILLQNMEASAQGAGPPPRFLMMNWPCGVMKYAFNPSNPGAAWTASSTFGQPGYILEPFAAPELKPISIFVQGMDTTLQCPGGGGHEVGTPFVTTGANSPGTRSNGGEADDGSPISADRVAAERLLAKNARALARVSDPRQRRQRAYALLARHGFDPETCRDVAALAVVADIDEG